MNVVFLGEVVKQVLPYFVLLKRVALSIEHDVLAFVCHTDLLNNMKALRRALRLYRLTLLFLLDPLDVFCLFS